MAQSGARRLKIAGRVVLLCLSESSDWELVTLLPPLLLARVPSPPSDNLELYELLLEELRRDMVVNSDVSLPCRGVMNFPKWSGSSFQPFGELLFVGCSDVFVVVVVVCSSRKCILVVPFPPVEDSFSSALGDISM